MADNTPEPKDAPRPPTPPAKGFIPVRVPALNTQPMKKGGAGKLVVMLSSVAKPPPALSQPLAPAAPLPNSASPQAPSLAAPVVKSPPPLPPKQAAPTAPPLFRPSSTTHVKLPPKTSVPRLNSLAGPVNNPPPVEKQEPSLLLAAGEKEIAISKPLPPPLPLKRPEPARVEAKKPGAQHIPPIKFNPPPTSSPAESDAESLFAPVDSPEPEPTPKGWKNLEPGELNPLPANLQSMEVFARSQRILGKLNLAAPVPTPKEPAPIADAKAPLLRPPVNLVGNAAPPERQTFPPLAEKAAELSSPAEKLPPPNITPEATKSELPPIIFNPPVSVAEPAPVPKVPALIQPELESQAASKLPPPLEAKSILPPASQSTQPASSDNERKKSAPIIVSSFSPVTSPVKVAETKAEVAPTPPPLPKIEAPAVSEPSPPLPDKPVLPPPIPIAEVVNKIAEIKPEITPAPPALPKTEAPAVSELPPSLTDKPVLPPPIPVTEVASKVAEVKPEPAPSPPILAGTESLEAATPYNPLTITATPLLSPTPSLLMPVKIEEPKPALKPPVLPNRTLAALGAAEVAKPDSSAKAPEVTETKSPPPGADQTPKVSETAPPAKPPEAGPLESPILVAEKPVTAAPVSEPPAASPILPVAKEPLPQTRAGRLKKRRMMETIFFWAVLVPITVAALFAGSLYFGQETRVEGQVIPPAGMILNNEVWIVTDFSSLAAGIAEDLAKDRTPLQQQIQEHQEHVQRAQADVASREERIRLINQEIQASKDDIDALVKQSRDATQQIWDGPGAQIDVEYQAHFDQLKNAIAARAKSLKLNYQPDQTYQSPEVWANAYRLALYTVPAGVDTVKEHQWLGDQMKQWRAFLKTLDERKEQLRDKAAELKLAPAPKIADLNAKIDDLQHRIDVTAAEEVPLKAELQQALTDLVAAQATDAGLDDKYYKQLDALPAEAITKHIPLATNGRFTWIDDDVFAEGEKQHHYWIFACATRADGRQYWVLGQFVIERNHKRALLLEPNSFISTKAILRPNLSPDEQAQ